MSRNIDDNKKQLPHENEVSQGKCISTDLTGNVETVVLLSKGEVDSKKIPLNLSVI